MVILYTKLYTKYQHEFLNLQWTFPNQNQSRPRYFTFHFIADFPWLTSAWNIYACTFQVKTYNLCIKMILHKVSIWIFIVLYEIQVSTYLHKWKMYYKGNSAWKYCVTTIFCTMPHAVMSSITSNNKWLSSCFQGFKHLGLVWLPIQIYGWEELVLKKKP